MKTLDTVTKLIVDNLNKTGEFIPHSEVNRASVLTDGILGYKLAGGRK